MFCFSCMGPTADSMVVSRMTVDSAEWSCPVVKSQRMEERVVPLLTLSDSAEKVRGALPVADAGLVFLVMIPFASMRASCCRGRMRVNSRFWLRVSDPMPSASGKPRVRDHVARTLAGLGAPQVTKSGSCWNALRENTPRAIAASGSISVVFSQYSSAGASTTSPAGLMVTVTFRPMISLIMRVNGDIDCLGRRESKSSFSSMPVISPSVARAMKSIVHSKVV